MFRTPFPIRWLLLLTVVLVAALSSCADLGRADDGEPQPERTSEVWTEADENERDEKDRDEREQDEREAEERDGEREPDENEQDENEDEPDENERDEA